MTHRHMMILTSILLAGLGLILFVPARSLASCTWSTFSTPNVTLDNFLDGIAAVSAKDAIAVGDSEPSGGNPSALILAYGGTPPTWKVVSFKEPGVQSVFVSVSPFSSNGAWLAGSYNPTSSSGPLPLAGKLLGSTFTNLGAPAPPTAVSTQLRAVLTLTPTTAMFVGRYDTISGLTQNYALKWTGTSFVNLNAPNSPTVSSDFRDVKGVPGTSNVVVSGFHRDADGDSVPFVYVYHTSTNTWSTPRALDPSINGAYFLGLAAASSTEIWAAGRLQNGSKDLPMIQKFNESTSTFTLQSLPSFSPSVRLASVAARSSTNVLAVGWTETGTMPVALEWNGTTWSNQSPSISGPVFESVAAVPGTTSYFAAGYDRVGLAVNTVVAAGSCT